ncbi:MAG: uroporphyrinogen decarboxylase family protein [Moorellales bacterium]
MDVTPDRLYQERLRRVQEAVALRVPDRVPVTVSWGFFPARYCGITFQEFMYEPEKILQAAIKVHEEFAPDLAQNPFGLYYLGPMLEALDFKQLRWPGHNLPANTAYQFVEGEYMPAEEYDHFLSDPSDWIMRKYLPRICGALTAFGELPPMRYLSGQASFIGWWPLATEDGKRALEALAKASEAAAEIRAYSQRFDEEIAQRGFPSLLGGTVVAPFDLLGDFFRGTRGILLDMYRRPDKLLKALETITPWQIERATSTAKANQRPWVFIPLHKGANDFMSNEQFATFYWPGLRDLIYALVEEGLTPMVFVESDYSSRLEFMKEVPPGKVVYHFEKTDIFAAKKILGDRVCLRGNVPISLLCVGTPEEVREYCRKLIDEVGRGGGFILDASTHVEDARPENVKAMIEFAKEYGVYR